MTMLDATAAPFGADARAFVLLKSRRRLDLLNPDPQAWTDGDLAAGFSRTMRWVGASQWAHPLSVAQHSLTVPENLVPPFPRSRNAIELRSAAMERSLSKLRPGAKKGVQCAAALDHLTAGYAHMACYGWPKIGSVNIEIMPLRFAGDRLADRRI